MLFDAETQTPHTHTHTQGAVQVGRFIGSCMTFDPKRLYHGAVDVIHVAVDIAQVKNDLSYSEEAPMRTNVFHFDLLAVKAAAATEPYVGPYRHRQHAARR